MDKRFYNIYNNNEQLESKRFGEVYTPEYIVKSMVDKIPDEVWNNKNIKVLDFACGCGIFAFFIYKKLIQYFDHDYIISNILYFNDVQEKNINKIKYIFNNPQNIYQGNFLEWNCNVKFNVIIGNPPFQAHNKKRSNGNSIWHKFVDKLLTLLQDNGYLSLIHPSGWRKPSTSKCKYTYLYEELTQKRQMIYLEMYSSKDGLKNFNCNVLYDIYLIKNTLPIQPTIIADHDKKIVKVNLTKLKFIPNKQIKLIYKLLKCKGDKINIIYSRTIYGSDKAHVVKECNDTYKYPLIHSVRKNDINYRYSSVYNIEHFGISKIIVSPLPLNVCNFYADIDGKYGMTNAVFGIVIKNQEQANKISLALKTKKFLNFKQAFTFHSNAFEFRCFYYFNDGIWNQFLKGD